MWAACLAPALVLPGALNRFVFVKLAAVALAVALALTAAPVARLRREATLAMWSAAAVLVVGALAGAEPVAQLIGRAPRYEGVVSLSVYGAAVALGAWLLGSPNRRVLRRHAVRATAVAASLVALVAAAEAVGLRPLATTTARPGSLLGNATEQGAYGVGVLILGLGLGVAVGEVAVGWVATVSGAILVATSASRGSLLGLAVGLATWLVLDGRVLRDRRVWGTAGALVVVGLLIPLTRSRVLLMSPLATQTITGRLQEWSSVAGILAHRPFLGVGPSGFVDAWPSVQTAGYVRLAGVARLDSPHSLPLQVLLSGGILLLVPVVAVLVIAVRVVRDRRRRGDDIAWTVATASALAGWAGVLLTHFTAPGSTPFFALFLGSLLAVPADPSRAVPRRVRLVGAGIAAAAVLVLGAAAAAEIPLRSGLVELQRGDTASAVRSFDRARAWRWWDADLDAAIAHAIVSQPSADAPLGLAADRLATAQGRLRDDPGVATDAGLLAQEQGDLGRAVVWYSRALALSPNDPQALALRGAARGRQGDTTGAVADLTASASLTPQDPAPLRALATVYQGVGDTAKADDLLARAARLTSSGG